MYTELFKTVYREKTRIKKNDSIEDRLHYIARLVNYNTVPDSADMCLIRNALVRSANLGIWAYSCDHTLNNNVLDKIYDIVVL